MLPFRSLPIKPHEPVTVDRRLFREDLGQDGMARRGRDEHVAVALVEDMHRGSAWPAGGGVTEQGPRATYCLSRIGD